MQGYHGDDNLIQRRRSLSWDLLPDDLLEAALLLLQKSGASEGALSSFTKKRRQKKNKGKVDG